MRNTFDQNLHRRFLVILLVEIFKQLNEKVAFKGGTCAALFYNLNRFSFDLDFDVLKELGQEDNDAIRSVLLREGAIKDFYDKLHTIFFLFDYKRDYPNIKIEFNKRIWNNNNYKTVWFMGVRMKIVDEATLLTNKLVALSDRKAPVSRDLFDAYYFLNLRFPVNEGLIKERTGKTKKEYFDFLIPFIEKHYNQKNILQGLGQSLDEDQKQWAKGSLIEETIKLIQAELK